MIQYKSYLECMKCLFQDFFLLSFSGYDRLQMAGTPEKNTNNSGDIIPCHPSQWQRPMAKMALVSAHAPQWVFHGRGQEAGPLPAELPGGCLPSPDFLEKKGTEMLLAQPAKAFSIYSRPLTTLSDTQHRVLCHNYTKDNCVLCSVGRGSS